LNEAKQSLKRAIRYDRAHLRSRYELFLTRLDRLRRSLIGGFSREAAHGPESDTKDPIFVATPAQCSERC
jgi:hypothetical protein